jgi:hypothetical protein
MTLAQEVCSTQLRNLTTGAPPMTKAKRSRGLEAADGKAHTRVAHPTRPSEAALLSPD